MEDALASRDEAESLLGISPTAFEEVVDHGHVVPVKVRGKERYDVRQLRWVARLLKRCRSMLQFRRRRLVGRASQYAEQLRAESRRIRRSRTCDERAATLGEALANAAEIIDRALPSRK